MSVENPMWVKDDGDGNIGTNWVTDHEGRVHALFVGDPDAAEATAVDFDGNPVTLEEGPNGERYAVTSDGQRVTPRTVKDLLAERESGKE